MDINPDRIGLTKPVTVGIVAMPKRSPTSILEKLGAMPGKARISRQAVIAQTKSAWAQELTSLTHEEDDPGTTWNERARTRGPKRPAHGLARYYLCLAKRGDY